MANSRSPAQDASLGPWRLRRLYLFRMPYTSVLYARVMTIVPGVWSSLAGGPWQLLPLELISVQSKVCVFWWLVTNEQRHRSQLCHIKVYIIWRKLDTINSIREVKKYEYTTFVVKFSPEPTPEPSAPTRATNDPKVHGYGYESDCSEGHS